MSRGIQSNTFVTVGILLRPWKHDDDTDDEAVIDSAASDDQV